MTAAVIRPARADDVEAVQAVEVDAGERFRTIGLDRIADDDPPTAAEILAHVGNRTAWVAERAGGVVGYAVASVVDGEGHLDQVSVVRRAAGAGIGRALVEHVVAWAAGAGLHAVTLTTFRDVPWNGPSYARLGFREVPDRDLGPELAAVRARERAAGLDVLPRIAMRRPTSG